MSIVVNEDPFKDEELDDVVDLDQAEIREAPSIEDNADDLEAEIKDELPEKFKGKDATEIAKAYTELEKEFGRKNNEVGELRRLTDDFLKQQIDTPTQETKEPTVDLDGFLDDPNKAVNEAIDNNPTVAKLQEQLQQTVIAEKRKGFEAKHTDWNDVLQSGDFQSWVTASPVRQQMFTTANVNYDYAVLDEVFSLYKDVRGVAKVAAEEKASTNRKKALKNTSVEKGSTGEVTKKVYRRADLIRLKQTNPQRYSDMSDEIYLAYQEGRVK